MDQQTLEKANSLKRKIEDVKFKLKENAHFIDLIKNSINERKFTAGYHGKEVEIPKPIRREVFEKIHEQYQQELKELKDELKAL